MLNLRRFVVVVSVVSAVSGILASSALSAVVQQNPVADAFVASSTPSGNYGGGGALSVAASGLAKGEFQTVIRFDGSAVKAASDAAYGVGQWTVQSVTLTLMAASPSNSLFNSSAAGQFSVDWMANDSWAEGSGKPGTPGATGITFSSLPTFESAGDQLLGTFSYGGATSGANTYTLGLGSSFVTDLLGGNQASLRLYAADATVSYLFNSGNNATAANWPVLTVTTTVPEPVTLSMLGAMSLLLLGRRRMHK
jgi:hypothetical protein